MPTYEVDVQGLGTIEFDADRELSPAEIIYYGQQQAAKMMNPSTGGQTPTEPDAPPHPDSYFGRVGRRIGNAASAAADIPKNVFGVATMGYGGEKGFLESGLGLLEGISSPVTALLSPVGAAVESGAAALGASDEAAQGIGSLGEVGATLGLGLLAKAGSLGPVGMQLATFLGVGRAKTIEEMMKHDPQLRYVLEKNYGGQVSDSLEALARSPNASMEEVALKANSPAIAASLLDEKQAASTNWQQFAARDQIIAAEPPEPSFLHGLLTRFQSGMKDLGFFGRLGTPSHTAAMINPLGKAAEYEISLAEINKINDVRARGNRDLVALRGVGDNDLRTSVRYLLSDREPAEVLGLAEDKINQGAKDAFKYLTDKFGADKEIILPKMRENLANKIRNRVTEELSARLGGAEPAAEAVEAEVTRRVKMRLPDSYDMSQFLVDTHKGFFRVLDEKGNLLAVSDNKWEAADIIHNFYNDGIRNMKVVGQVFHDADTLRRFQGRNRRTLEAIAKAAQFTDEEMALAEKGMYGGKSAVSPLSSLIERYGQGKGYNRDLLYALDNYNSSVGKFNMLQAIHEKVDPVVRELDARGYRSLAASIQENIKSLSGFRMPGSQLLDNTLSATPVVRSLVSPYFMERWIGGAKAGVVNLFLNYNPRFHAVNALQTLSTLWPIADAREIWQGFKLWRSAEGAALLKEHGMTDIGSKVSDIAGATIIGKPEKMNQEVAFLTMFNRAKKLGLSDLQAADYGKLRGNVYSQFLGLTSDRPTAFRNFDPWGLSTMFKRYEVKQAEMALDLIMDKNFPGAAKWLAANMLVGGFKAATMGTSGWLTYQTYKEIEKAYGKTVADVFHSGIPALGGIDVSNSVMLFNPPMNETWAESIGATVGGIMGSTAFSVIAAAQNNAAPEPEAAKRAFDALAQRVPMMKELQALALLITGEQDLKDPLGRLKYKADGVDLFKRFLGFKPLSESKVDTAISALMEVKDRRDNTLNYAASRYGQAMLSGISLGPDMEKAIQGQIDGWNGMWPEFYITGSDIMERAKSRMEATQKTLQERILKNVPRVMRNSEAFADFTPGGG